MNNWKNLYYQDQMDRFKEEQLNKIGMGGLRCYCCNDFLKYQRRCNKRVNRIARARLKAATIKLININVRD